MTATLHQQARSNDFWSDLFYDDGDDGSDDMNDHVRVRCDHDSAMMMMI